MQDNVAGRDNALVITNAKAMTVKAIERMNPVAWDLKLPVLAPVLSICARLIYMTSMR